MTCRVHGPTWVTRTAHEGRYIVICLKCEAAKPANPYDIQEITVEELLPPRTPATAPGDPL